MGSAPPAASSSHATLPHLQSCVPGGGLFCGSPQSDSTPSEIWAGQCFLQRCKPSPLEPFCQATLYRHTCSPVWTLTGIQKPVDLGHHMLDSAAPKHSSHALLTVALSPKWFLTDLASLRNDLMIQSPKEEHGLALFCLPRESRENTFF